MIRTEQLKQLIADDSLCISLATYKDSFKATLYQIQLGAVTEENKDRVGDVVLALSMIHEIFDDFIARGDALIVEKEKKQPK